MYVCMYGTKYKVGFLILNQLAILSCLHEFDWPFICAFERILLNLLVGHFGEMHGKWPVQWPPVILYSDGAYMYIHFRKFIKNRTLTLGYNSLGMVKIEAFNLTIVILCTRLLEFVTSNTLIAYTYARTYVRTYVYAHMHVRTFSIRLGGGGKG